MADLAQGTTGQAAGQAVAQARRVWEGLASSEAPVATGDADKDERAAKGWMRWQAFMAYDFTDCGVGTGPTASTGNGTAVGMDVNESRPNNKSCNDSKRIDGKEFDMQEAAAPASKASTPRAVRDVGMQRGSANLSRTPRGTGSRARAPAADAREDNTPKPTPPKQRPAAAASRSTLRLKVRVLPEQTCAQATEISTMVTSAGTGADINLAHRQWEAPIDAQ